MDPCKAHRGIFWYSTTGGYIRTLREYWFPVVLIFLPFSVPAHGFAGRAVVSSTSIVSVAPDINHRHATTLCTGCQVHPSRRWTGQKVGPEARGRLVLRYPKRTRKKRPKRRKVELAGLKTISGYVNNRHDLLKEGTIAERRSFIRSLVREVTVTGDEVVLNYILPLPDIRTLYLRTLTKQHCQYSTINALDST